MHNPPVVKGYDRDLGICGTNQELSGWKVPESTVQPAQDMEKETEFKRAGKERRQLKSMHAWAWFRLYRWGVLSGVDLVSVCNFTTKKALTLTEFLKHFARRFFTICSSQ